MDCLEDILDRAGRLWERSRAGAVLVEKGECTGGVPLSLIDFPRAGGWGQPGSCYGENADVTRRAQRLPTTSGERRRTAKRAVVLNAYRDLTNRLRYCTKEVRLPAPVWLNDWDRGVILCLENEERCVESGWRWPASSAAITS